MYNQYDIYIRNSTKLVNRTDESLVLFNNFSKKNCHICLLLS